MERSLCVRTHIAVRKVQRHPVVKRTVRHVVRGTTVGFVPSALNDVVFHHAPIDLSELIHATQDTLAVTILNVAIHIVTKLVV
jgi:hypothetical protein